MSESMAIETLTGHWMAAQLHTAFSATRYRLLAWERGYTDVDALACAPEVGRLALAECKVRDGAQVVYAIRDEPGLIGGSYAAAALNMLQLVFSDRNAWVAEQLQYGGGWRRLVDGAAAGLPDCGVDLYLVANVFVHPDERAAVDARFTEELLAAGTGMPKGVALRAHVRSTLDVILGSFDTVQSWVRDDGWGARFGDPQLNLLRELARYADPVVRQGGAGLSAACKADTAQAFRARFGDR